MGVKTLSCNVYVTGAHCNVFYFNALMQCYCTAEVCFTSLHSTTLHCITMHCTALYCTVLHCNTLHCTALYWNALLHCTALHRAVCLLPHSQYCILSAIIPITALYCIYPKCSALQCTLLNCTAQHYTALHGTVAYSRAGLPECHCSVGRFMRPLLLNVVFWTC